VQDASFVCVVQSPEQTTEVFPDVWWIDILVKQLETKARNSVEPVRAVVSGQTHAEIIASVIWHDSNDLVLRPKGGNQLRGVSTSPDEAIGISDPVIPHDPDH